MAKVTGSHSKDVASGAQACGVGLPLKGESVNCAESQAASASQSEVRLESLAERGRINSSLLPSHFSSVRLCVTL